MKIRNNVSDRIFIITNYTILIILFFIIAYPLVYVLSASISSPTAVNAGRMWLLPVDITFEGFTRISQNIEIWIGYRNTVLYTIIGTLYNLLMTIPCAYALSVKNLVGRTVITKIFLFTMFFNGGLIATYFLNKDLSLVGNPLVLILPTGASVMHIIISRTFFTGTIPGELVEAAEIDGCSPAYTFIRIVVPLSKPIIAIIALYCAVGHWNSYFSAMIYLSDRHTFPLQLFLREILVQQQMSAAMMEDMEDLQYLVEKQRIAELVKYSTMIVSSLPLLIVYPFLQKFFVKGIMIGSIKG